MSSLDDELDREVQNILTRGEEGRRNAAVKELTASSTGSIVLRIAGVAAGIVVVALLLHVVGLVSAAQAVRGLCAALGLCG